MQNLKYSYVQEAPFANKETLPCITAWDTTNDSLICAFGPTRSSSRIDLRRVLGSDATKLEQYGATIASWDVPRSSSDLDCDSIISLQHFPDIATTCLILAGGDLILVRHSPQQNENQIEIVGSISDGIAAAAWAPDEELLAVVTNADALLLMTREFESVVESKLSKDDLAASKHVSVGWGKKETQFQGKRARALQDPTMPTKLETGKLSDYDDKRTTISWRGDGAFLVVNRIVSGSRRVIRVLTRDGILDGVSEPVDGLESALGWRPAGNLVAGVQRLTTDLNVIFFERNGLRHGEFSLRLSKSDTVTWASSASMAWSLDSTVLAVSFCDRVQLWTMSNYHYYLKREVRFDKGVTNFARYLSWHPEKPLRLAMVTGTSVLDLDHVLEVDRGPTVQSYDHGIVAVVDGSSLKLTPLRYAMVPPPMSFLEIVAGECIVDCAISPQGDRVAILSGNSITVYAWNLRLKPAISAKEVCSLVLRDDHKGDRIAPFRQVMMRSNDSVTLMTPTRDGGFQVRIYIINESSNKLAELETEAQRVEGEICCLYSGLYTSNDCRYLWAKEKNTLRCLNQSFPVSPFPTYRAAEIVCPGEPYLQGEGSLSILGGNGCRESSHVFSLSRNGHLFANGKLLTKGCSSFATTQLHLVFTTSQNMLKFVHLDKSGDYQVPPDKTATDELCRSIERGARIVTIIPSTYAVVLQLPRGNLETVYPRALVLAGIRQHLDEKDFRAAYLACVNHQVDLNIICDYKPALLMEHVAAFVDQVDKADRIDLFLSKLSEDDVSQTLYKDTLDKGSDGNVPHSLYWPYSTNSNTSAEDEAQGKVNKICNRFLSILKPRIASRLQNVVTAYVCKRPPDLVSALELIGSLRKDHSPKAEEAVSHLCFLSDVNRLYDTALSLYDLPLTLLIAQLAQRDPREYMPFLESLNAAPPLQRHFRIDDHLHNYEKALTSLHTLAAHDEVEQYTIRHALFSQAIQLYRHDRENLINITRHHAGYLTSQSDHLGAAIALESLTDHQGALTSYSKCSPPRWREALHCAFMIDPPLSKEDMHSLALKLASALTDIERDYRPAAQIHIDYLHDIPTAAQLLCKGCYFAEALRLLSFHKLASQIPAIVDPALAKKSGEITELITDCRLQLSAQVPRVKELRIKKAQDPLGFFGGDAGGGADNEAGVHDTSDNVSLAPTDVTSTLGGQSLFTRYGNASNASTGFSGTTRKTSKTRRKEERKRARGKKGSIYEEEYLVNSVRRLIEKVNSVHSEVQRLVEGLARRTVLVDGEAEAADRAVGIANADRRDVVEEMMTTMVNECDRAVKEVWGPPSDGAHQLQHQINGNEDNPDHSRIAPVGIVNQQHPSPHPGSSSYPAVMTTPMAPSHVMPSPSSTRPKGADGVLWQSQMETQLVAANYYRHRHHPASQQPGAEEMGSSSNSISSRSNSSTVEVPKVRPWKK